MTNNHGSECSRVDGSAVEISVGRQRAQWEKNYRIAFERDGGRRLLTDIERFGLPGTPKDMLEATIDLVTICIAFRQLDGNEVSDFLASQTYDEHDLSKSPYRLIFNIGYAAAAAVVTDRQLRSIDLADLYGIQWERLRRVGYSEFWVVRNDGLELDAEEVATLDEAITADLRFDYSEDEIDFYFDPDTWSAALYCSVHDCEDDE